MWPFNVRIVDDDIVVWQLRCFEWLFTHIRDGTCLAATTLILPGRGHFLADGETGHALTLRICAQVRAYGRLRWLSFDRNGAAASARHCVSSGVSMPRSCVCARSMPR